MFLNDGMKWAQSYQPSGVQLYDSYMVRFPPRLLWMKGSGTFQACEIRDFNGFIKNIVDIMLKTASPHVLFLCVLFFRVFRRSFRS